jgi:hypothetical protein
MSSFRDKALTAQPGEEIARLPAGFFEARAIVQMAMVDCDMAAIPGDAIAAALMSEALPRLAEMHGSEGCARILNCLTSMIEKAHSLSRTTS